MTQVREAAEGWVLAGGRSRRMGRDKAGVVVAGRPLLEHMLDTLRTAGVAARVAGLRAPVAGMAATVLPDAHPDCGPLSGLETALAKSKSNCVLTVGVDLPLLEPEFLTWMVARAVATGACATIPRVLGEAQPLCAVYRRELLAGVTEALETGEYKITPAVLRAAGASVDLFDVERTMAADGLRCSRAPHEQFMNCNTPEDAALAARALSLML